MLLVLVKHCAQLAILLGEFVNLTVLVLMCRIYKRECIKEQRISPRPQQISVCL